MRLCTSAGDAVRGQSEVRGDPTWWAPFISVELLIFCKLEVFEERLKDAAKSVFRVKGQRSSLLDG